MSVKIYPPSFDGDMFSVYVCYGYRSYLYALCHSLTQAIAKRDEVAATL